MRSVSVLPRVVTQENAVCRITAIARIMETSKWTALKMRLSGVPLRPAAFQLVLIPVTVKLSPPPVEVRQQHKLPATSPPPRHTLTVIATEFASELILVSLEIVVRLLTATVRATATSRWNVTMRELSGARSRRAVSLDVKQIVDVVVIIVSFNQDSLDDRKKQMEIKIMAIFIFSYAENGLIHPENFPLL